MIGTCLVALSPPSATASTSSSSSSSSSSSRMTIVVAWIAATLASSTTLTDAFTPKYNNQHHQQYSNDDVNSRSPSQSSKSSSNSSSNSNSKITCTNPTLVGVHQLCASSQSSVSRPERVSFDQLRQLEAVYKINVNVKPVNVNVDIDDNKVAVGGTGPRSGSGTAVVSTKTSGPTALATSTLGTAFKVITSTDNNHRRLKIHRPFSQYCRVEAVAALTAQKEQQQSQSQTISKRLKSSRSGTATKGNTNTLSSCGLTRDEEIQYSFQLRTFRAALRLRDALVNKQYNMFIHPTEQEWADACGTSIADLRRVMHEGREARTALVSANIGLVTSQAKKFYHATKQSMQSVGCIGTILTLQDLIQEGNLGLMEAAERYQPEKGFRFSTYATWWVRQRISKGVTESSRTIRLPSYVHTMLQKVNRARTMIKNETGKDPTLQQLSDYLDIPVDKLQQYTKSSQNVVSLESPLRTNTFKDDTRTIGDTLASDSPTPYEDAEAEHLRRDIRAVIDSSLQEVERDVILYRYGFDIQQKPRTVAETAHQLNISTDRVRLYEARALNKLRHPQRNNVLKEYMSPSWFPTFQKHSSTIGDDGTERNNNDGVDGRRTTTTIVNKKGNKININDDGRVQRSTTARRIPIPVIDSDNRKKSSSSCSVSVIRPTKMENRFVVFEKSDIEIIDDDDALTTTTTTTITTNTIKQPSSSIQPTKHQQVWLF